MAFFIRQEYPPQFDDYRKYRPFLRRDFRFMCAYCERPEFALGGEESFEIDHFRPKGGKFQSLEAHYPNLYYACAKCNRYKGAVWPSDELMAEGFQFADPCQEDMYSKHLREQPASGELKALTNCGLYTAEKVRLNRPALLAWRQDRQKASADLDVLADLADALEHVLAEENLPERRIQIAVQVTVIRSKVALVRALYAL